MISFSAAHNGNNPSPFGAQTKSKAPASPLENVTMLIHKNQICSLQVPQGTPRARAIRQWLSTYGLNPTTNVRLWIFRRNINWTTIALESTDEQLKLTASPAEAAMTTRREMNRCPEVGEFKVLDWNNNVVADDISIDSFAFDPMVPITEPSDSAVPATGASTDAKAVQTSAHMGVGDGRTNSNMVSAHTIVVEPDSSTANKMMCSCLTIRITEIITDKDYCISDRHHLYHLL